MKREELVSELERVLIEAARKERLPAGAEERLAAALGISGGASFAVKSAVKSLFGKLAIGVAVGSVATVAIVHERSLSTPSVQVPAAVRSTSVVAPDRTPLALEEAAPTSTDESVPATPLKSRPSPPARPSAKRQAETVAVPVAPSSAADTPLRDAIASTLGEEVALLERAQKSLSARRFGEARALLDAYTARFANGLLQAEAAVLDADLYDAEGAHAQARISAKRALVLAPGGAHASRMRRLLAEP
jgi:hypothetical protein